MIAVTLMLSALALQRDTVPQRPTVLSPLLVTAERSAGSLSSSTAAVTSISRSDLIRFPRATLADLLRLAPGMTVVDFDGGGYDPQLMVRGFYGGGEAEYVVVLVDGVPQNRLETGTVAWDALPPLASIEALEIVRGGASSLYGDAAIGGVINVITRGRQGAETRRSARWNADGGSYETLRAEADLRERSLGIAGALDRSGGYREHAERISGRLRGTLQAVRRPAASIRLDASGHWRGWDDPGPLLQSQMEEPRASDALFRFDHTSDQDYALGVTGERTGSGWRGSALVRGDFRSTDAIKTLALAPGFGDTKERLASTSRAGVGLQLERGGVFLSARDQLVVGLEAGFGRLDSKYYQYQGGTREDYLAASGSRGSLDTRSSSDRASAAVFGQYAVTAGPVRLSLGARWDGLHDRFRPQEPSGSEHRSTDHGALSPRAGINIRLTGEEQAFRGHLYASASRSFKAPTLDQLYDQRNIPVPFPPFQIQTSNPELSPQHGTNVDAGTYLQLSSGGIRGALSLSVYQTRMTDEIDFDLNTFRYVNIGKSRHRGIETGLDISGGAVSVFLNYSLQHAVAQSGEHAGNRLKAIPRHSVTGGGSLDLLARRISVGGTVTHLQGMFLDDANTTRLENFTRVDGRLTVRAAGMSFFSEVRNLFDALYASTGYLDPSGSGEAYLYPAAGRSVRLGVTGNW